MPLNTDHRQSFFYTSPAAVHLSAARQIYLNQCSLLMEIYTDQQKVWSLRELSLILTSISLAVGCHSKSEMAMIIPNINVKQNKTLALSVLLCFNRRVHLSQEPVKMGLVG